MDVDQQLVHKKTTVTTPAKSQPKGKQKAAGKRLEKIITGAQISDSDKSFIRSIFIYDIPTSWTAEKILSELKEWGVPLDMTVKRQRKYQTVKVRIVLSSFTCSTFDKGSWMYTLGSEPVRWYPGDFTLSQRKQREKFQLQVDDFHDNIQPADL